MEESIKVQVTKELTLKAMESNLFLPFRDDKSNGEALGIKIADLFNSILQNIQC